MEPVRRQRSRKSMRDDRDSCCDFTSSSQELKASELRGWAGSVGEGGVCGCAQVRPVQSLCIPASHPVTLQWPVAADCGKPLAAMACGRWLWKALAAGAMLPRALLFSRTGVLTGPEKQATADQVLSFTVQSARGGHDSDSVKSQVNTSIEFTA